MLKPYNRAELSFGIIRELDEQGANSTVSLIKDYQLDAELVLKRIPKKKINNKKPTLMNQRFFINRHIQTLSQFVMLAKIMILYTYQHLFIKKGL